MQVLKWVLVAIAVIQLICTIISSAIAYFKNKQLSVTEIVNFLLTVTPDIVVKAEEMFGRGNGNAKKDWAMTKLNLLALQEGHIIDQETLSNAIENVVKTTKNVNVVTKIEEEKDNGQA